MLVILILVNSIYSQTLSEVEKTEILTLHNYYRSQVAMGLVEDQPPARSMQLLEWNSQLEEEAQKCADQVNMTPCQTEKGHLLYHTKKIVKSVGEAVKHWFNKHVQFNSMYLKNYKPNNAFEYTQLVWGETNLVGCGRQIKQEGNRTTIFIVCYYFPAGNIADRKVYQIGKPGEGCQQKQMYYPGLCVAVKEIEKLKTFTFPVLNFEDYEFFKVKNINQGIENNESTILTFQKKIE